MLFYYWLWEIQCNFNESEIEIHLRKLITKEVFQNKSLDFFLIQ